jgi:iduronate 2-sulfatase
MMTFLALGVLAREQAYLPQTNVLLIMFDDLRPDLSIYGKEHMKTPNFERLAKRGVVFDLAVSQVAVCNPSRNSMLTGMRPDTTGSYNMQTSDMAHKVFPEYLVQAGYKTAAYGKIRHYEAWDKHIWSHDHYEGDWYQSLNKEYTTLNASVVADGDTKEEDFRDYHTASKAITGLKELHGLGSYFMAAVGFKLPHMPLYVPKSYYDMYEEDADVFTQATDIERKFPKTAPLPAYKCCANDEYGMMKQGMAGASVPVGQMGTPTAPEVHAKHLRGYAAAISFVDAQLGRLLDTIDSLELWSNITVVATSDHGTHLGEKGMWGKWSLFDESARVPLIIAHPSCPYKNSHVYEPVELVDVFPTVLDLVSSPHIRGKTIMHAHSRAVKDSIASASASAGTAGHARMRKRGDGSGGGGKKHTHTHDELGGKSLAPLVVGTKYKLSLQRARGGHGRDGGAASHRHSQHQAGTAGSHLHSGFAITQALRCAKRGTERLYKGDLPESEAQAVWGDCDLSADTKANTTAIEDYTSIMGYSMRTIDFRYTLWLYFDRAAGLIQWDLGVFGEELYDHREEGQGDLGKFELGNLLSPDAPDSVKQQFRDVAKEQRTMLVHFLQRQITFKKHLASNWAHDDEYERYESGKRAFTEQYLKGGGEGSASGIDDGSGNEGRKPAKLARREEKKLKEFIKEFANDGTFTGGRQPEQPAGYGGKTE